MHIGYASDVEALLHRAGTPGLAYRQFRNPPTRRSPPPETAEPAAPPAAAGLIPEAPAVFPVPPMATILRLAAAPALRAAGPDDWGATAGSVAMAAAPPPQDAAGATLRLPLVEAALSAAPPASPPPAGSTLARLRAAIR